MKKLTGLLLVSLLIITWCPTALAFQNEHSFWDQWRDHDRRHANDREYARHEGHGGQTVVRYRDRDDHYWYGQHRISNMRVYYSDRADHRVSRVSYENYDGERFLATIRHEHGRYSYWRYHHGERYYYWIGRETIIRVAVREDGRTITTVWYRAEAERNALELGYVSGSTVEAYQDYDDMPPEVAQRYIADIGLND
ncbi:MAG: hypothetical protein P4N41_01710 [Negativicutes bacterium]|nr:hypothetical protein [Negativicutes bacterium]